MSNLIKLLSILIILFLLIPSINGNLLNNDNELKFKNELEEDGFSFINSVIENDLKNILKEDTAKIIGTIYRSIKRHTSGRREYLDFIQQHVGLRVGSGIRAIKNFL